MNAKDLAVLKLFKGFVSEKHSELSGFDQKALIAGVMIPESAPAEVKKQAVDLYGKDGALWNATFHKSWNKVAHASLAQLISEQLMHYFTTYGFESLGVYSEDTIYIPKEALDIPELAIDDKIKFVNIKSLTEEDVKSKLMALLTSGIALSEETIDDIKALSDLIDKSRFDEVANREVRTYLYDKYNVMPKDPEAFLRYLIFKATGSTLKIQNKAMFDSLKGADKELVKNMLASYLSADAQAEKRLASIFLRNKNLFLALKSDADTEEQKAINRYVNRLRKLAKTCHKALKPQVLDTLTVTKYSAKEIDAALDKATLFRAIRCLNALNYRLSSSVSDDIVYRVRNGRSFVSKIATESVKEAVLVQNKEAVQSYIVSKLAEKVSGKTVYIPEGIVYKAPTSEKQFVNDIPEGSYVELPADKNLIFAVHWNNLEPQESIKSKASRDCDSRVDLDMHMMNSSRQFGWNTSYRDEDSKILFSGDVTSAPAPHGATEAYFISHKLKEAAYLITLNDFNGHNRPVPYEFIVASDDVASSSFSRDYMVDPNKIIYKFNFSVKPESRQAALGLVKASADCTRFYFQNFGVGASGAVTVRNDYTVGAYNYLNRFNEIQVKLNDLLVAAGAKIVRTPTVKTQVAELATDEKGNPKAILAEKEVPADIDLSIENIDKSTIIELFSK